MESKLMAAKEGRDEKKGKGKGKGREEKREGGKERGRNSLPQFRQSYLTFGTDAN